MREAWWIPVGEVPRTRTRPGRILVNGQRTLPRSIMVNRKGRRFTNEAANYNAFGAAFHVEDVVRFEYANLPCWLIFDQNYVDTYGFRVRRREPRQRRSRLDRRAPTRWPSSAATSASTATNSKRPSRAGTRTCADGHDPDFGRGDSALTTSWWGDPHRKGRRDATLGPLDAAPYYAFEIHSGALGTKGGPRDRRRRPGPRPRRRADPGLYAAGNVMASPIGMTYGGPGGTIGPAMVFGYLAGRHAAARQRHSIPDRSDTMTMFDDILERLRANVASGLPDMCDAPMKVPASAYADAGAVRRTRSSGSSCGCRCSSRSPATSANPATTSRTTSPAARSSWSAATTASLERCSTCVGTAAPA